MRVILLKQQRNLGKIGEIVNVKGGYGRNFLLPQGIAIRATAENEQKLSEQKAVLLKKNEEALAHAQKLSKKIDNGHFVFIKQCADDGRLFGSVTSKEVASRVSEEAKEDICNSAVLLSQPIKNLGIFEVLVSVHPDVTSKVLVNIARSESEAADAFQEFKAGPKEEAPETQE